MEIERSGEFKVLGKEHLYNSISVMQYSVKDDSSFLSCITECIAMPFAEKKEQSKKTEQKQEDNNLDLTRVGHPKRCQINWWIYRADPQRRGLNWSLTFVKYLHETH